MALSDAFESFRAHIARSLEDYLVIKKSELGAVNRWGGDLAGRLLRFALNGKMVRGSLIILAYSMFARSEGPGRGIRGRERGPYGAAGKQQGAPEGADPSLFDPPRWVSDAAAAYELVHSSLLVHDDIMDRDRVRRGEPTIFHQFEELARDEGADEPAHVGTSLGICAGDVGFFLAFELLSSAAEKPRYAPGTASAGEGDRAFRILRLWARELAPVGLAQMDDVVSGASRGTRSEEDILNLYRYKTARYTFSIPFATGAIAAGQGPQTVARLEELGENLGILFQMKDDEIGLFGDETETGKPAGSDIEEGKQTLLARALAEKGGKAYEEIAARIRSGSAKRAGARPGTGPGTRPPGGPRARPGTDTRSSPVSDPETLREGAVPDLEALRALARDSGALQSLDRIREPLIRRAEKLIESLDVAHGDRALLRELLRYNLERRR